MELVSEILPALIEGAKVTVKLFGLTLIFSLPIGLLVGLASTARFQPLRFLIGLYTWVIRGTPLLLQIIFIFYGLRYLNESWVIQDRFTGALLALVINYVAYYAEIFRGGIQAVPKGQYEAAKVLGFTRFQTAYKIVVPQVFKTVLPSLGNEVITLVKDTSLVHIVGLTELLRAGQQAMAAKVSILPLVEVAVIYLLMTGIVTLILRQIERRFDYDK